MDRLNRRSPSTIPTRGLAVGIDLGTTYSSVGIFRNGKVEIITNDLGLKRTPSVVAFTENTGLVVGDPATNLRFSNPSNTVFDAKRMLGRRFEDPAVQADLRHWPFQVINEKGWPKVQVNFRGKPSTYAPERITAMLLIKLRGIAETYIGEPVSEAVITVPAHFNEYQKQATKDAARFAGLGVMRILKESAATAMAYKVLQNHKAALPKEEHNVLIIDLGGGSFDVSILSIHDSVLEVKATGGDTHLGGEDFDNRLAKHVASEFQRQHAKDPSSNKTSMERLRAACEKAKRNLSYSTQTTIDIECFFEGIDLHSIVTRSSFEDICTEYFVTITDALKKVVRDAKLERQAIHEVILVGGCTAIPKIIALVQDMFPGKELNKWLNSKDAVAYGAALQAGIMTHDSQILENMLLLDVTPHALGIETLGGIMSSVVKGDSAIPTRLSRSFTTCTENQPAVTIKVFEGSKASTKENAFLGLFTLNCLPPSPAGQVKIDVTFNVDADGTLEVSATHKASGKKNGIVIIVEKDQLLEDERHKKDDAAEYPVVEYQTSDKDEKKQGQQARPTPPQAPKPSQPQQKQQSKAPHKANLSGKQQPPGPPPPPAPQPQPPAPQKLDQLPKTAVVGVKKPRNAKHRLQRNAPPADLRNASRSFERSQHLQSQQLQEDMARMAIGQHLQVSQVVQPSQVIIDTLQSLPQAHRRTDCERF